MPTMLDHVSRGLRLLRKEQGLSQAKLAEAADVSTKLISAIEQGSRAPSLATLDKLCTALGVTPPELFALGRPDVPKATARGVAERVASMMAGLDETQEQHMLAVMRGVRELVLTEEAKQKPKRAAASSRRRYGKR